MPSLEFHNSIIKEYSKSPEVICYFTPLDFCSNHTLCLEFCPTKNLPGRHFSEQFPWRVLCHSQLKTFSGSLPMLPTTYTVHAPHLLHSRLMFKTLKMPIFWVTVSHTLFFLLIKPLANDAPPSPEFFSHPSFPGTYPFILGKKQLSSPKNSFDALPSWSNYTSLSRTSLWLSPTLTLLHWNYFACPFPSTSSLTAKVILFKFLFLKLSINSGTNRYLTNKCFLKKE